MLRLKKSLCFTCILVFALPVHGSDSDIFTASEQGDLEAVKELVQENPQLVNAVGNGGYGPLHEAAYNNHPDIVKYLVSQGADINATSGSGSTPLHGAASYGHTEMARLLLDLGAAPDITNAGGYTPLLGANAGNHPNIIRLLADKGANVNLSPPSGRAPLYQAVWNSDIDLARFLLEKGAETNIQTDRGVSLPFFATVLRDREFSIIFSSKIHDFTEKDSLGLSLLHYSVAFGSTEPVRRLLEQGVDVNARDSLGKTPLYYASLWGRDEVVEILKAHGATSDEGERAWFEGDFLGKPTPEQSIVEFVGDELRTPFAPHGSIAFCPDGTEMLWCHQELPNRAMWYSRQVDGVWQKPTIAPFTDPAMDYADGSPSFSADGSKIYFQSHRPQQEADGRQEDSDIWVVEKTGDDWGNPIPFGVPVNTDKNESGPSVALSGNIYFVGEGYENGYGEGDIYVSELLNGVYAAPRNLGPDVNSQYHEMTPFVSPDESYILFTTTDVGTYPWGLPLKVSFKRKDGSWSKAASLGETRGRGNIRNPFITADNKFVFYQQETSFYWFSTALIEDIKLAVIGPSHVEAATRIPEWRQSEQVFEPQRTNDIALGDLDSDGDLDAVFTNMGDNDSHLYLNDGHGHFTADQVLLSRGGHGVDLGDIDADGDLDVVISANGYGRDLMVYLNDGQANLSHVPQNLGDSVLASTSVSLYDVDTDGDLDAMVTYFREDNIIYLNDGGGMFSRTAMTFPNGSNWADLDGDGDVDILLRKTGVGFKSLLNDGTGHFVEHWSKPDSSVQRGWLALDDFDGDGDCDAVVPYSEKSEHDFSTLWYNDGTGRFIESDVRLPLTRLSRMSTGDLNNDGHTDVFLNNAGLPSAVWLNDGKGGLFDSGIRIPGEWRWLHTFCPLGDLDGDGDLDAFIASFMDGPNEVWFNE